LKGNYARFNLPADLTGKRVLDIGCWDGFYSFEAEAHGAEVLASDCWTPENIFKAKAARQAKLNFQEKTVYEITQDTVGTFDIVFFLGVLYHLRHPLLALEHVCEVTREFAIIESHVCDDFFEADMPLMEFYEFDELGGQHDNWWGPNVPCLLRMIRAAGFAHGELLRREPTRATIKAWRNWQDIPQETTPSLTLTGAINAVKYDKVFPRRGRHAILALGVKGLPPDTNRMDVRVEVGGYGVIPVYAGPWGGKADLEEHQINAIVPPGLPPGKSQVRVWHQDKISNYLEIELVDTPLIPAERVV
jgi:tRNA (mo5U34)-methyltransferase